MVRNDYESDVLIGPNEDRYVHHRNGSFYLLIASLFLISFIIYLCSYTDNRQFHIRAIYGPIAKFESNDLIVNSKYWNPHERDGSSSSSSSSHRDGSSSSFNQDGRKTSTNEIDYSKFDITADDVIVFLHIQNTGGNVFGRHLVEDLLLDRPCDCDNSKPSHRRKCQCFRPNRKSMWLFSRWTIGWKCGVHPDWTELTHCVDRVLDELEGDVIKRRYFYITLLRDPITRFISEYFHYSNQDYNNGKASRHWCGGKEVKSIPKCYFKREITINEFLNCSNNLAINRQTRMLSDLTLVGCYNNTFLSKEERDLIMLTSAKSNLHKMAYFGLTEFPRISQYLFQETFDLMFLDADTHSLHRNKRSLLDDFDSKTIEQIKIANYLDIELYEYAKELMFERFEKIKHRNPKLKHLPVIKVAKDNNDIVNWGESEDEQGFISSIE